MALEFKKGKEKINISIETSQLGPAQVRLVKALNAMMFQVMTTRNEADYFEYSAEFMRQCASAIKQSSFSQFKSEEESISYAEQAIEYSLDRVTTSLENSKIVILDN